MFNELIFYTDGSSRGNPGPGGFGVVCFNTAFSQTVSEYIDRHTINYTYAESFDNVTNNQMELRAILHVFELAAKHPEFHYTIYSDSTYAVNSINTWIFGWAKNGWINSKKKPVENLEIMQEIYKYVSFPLFNVDLKHIKGHNGAIGNELADALATGNEEKLNSLIKTYNIAHLNLFEEKE